MTGFRQAAPVPRNRFCTDRALRFGVERLLPADLFAALAPGLDRFGARCAAAFPALAAAAEAAPPRHTAFDAWGGRVDRIKQSAPFGELMAAAQAEGLVSVCYEPGSGGHGRVIQSALLALFEPVAATSTCPLAMTDAAATLLRTHDADLWARYGARLTARSGAITSGQWMTETSGGSDVGGIETVAAMDAQGGWRLSGLKWFTSATAADIALVLARTPGAAPGAAGLSLFLLEVRQPDGAWNGIEIRRLKDKLGTRAMPTAEIALCGARAVPVGGLGRGVAKAASMLNVARLWAGQAAPAATGYLLDLARDYAVRRQVGGAPLAGIPAHAAWLADIAARHEAMLALCFETARAAGDADASPARLLAPAMKFFCARAGIAACSELLESFGGAGYLEDTGLPAVFRNAHVHTIWEGTGSVMAHDVHRALTARGNAGLGAAWLADMRSRLGAVQDDCGGADGGVLAAASRIEAGLAVLAPLLGACEPACSRRVAYGIAAITAAVALAEGGVWRRQRKQDRTGLLALRIFTRHALVPPPAGGAEDDFALAFPDTGATLC